MANVNSANSVNTTMYWVGYVKSSTDGMSLFTGFDLFKSYEDAVKYIENDIQTSALDYVKNREFDGHEWEDADNMPDYYNEGGYCVGYYILDSIIAS